MSVEADVQFEMMQKKQSGIHASKEKISVPNFSGDSTEFRKWSSLLCSYIFNTGLHELDDEEPMLRLLDQKLSIGMVLQKMIECSRLQREENRLWPLTFAQEMKKLRDRFEPVEDPMHIMTEVQQREWDGKLHSLL